MCFPSLIERTEAVGVCLMMSKYYLYGDWYRSFGFDWLSAVGAGPSQNTDNPLVFLTTRDAYKDLLRFTIKHVKGNFCLDTERGQMVYEEVQRELAKERLDAVDHSSYGTQMSPFAQRE